MNIRCAFIEQLPKKMVYHYKKEQFVNLDGIIISGVLNDESYKIFNFDNKDITIKKNIDSSLIGLQEVKIEVHGFILSFNVYITPKEEIEI